MKRKVGFIIGYNGSGYHGLQWNKDLNTIEKEVIGILLSNGLVTELNSTDPQKIDMKSCSRTDKGVHASFNVVNAKINQEPTCELEAKLKEDFGAKGIHLYKMIRLPKKFIGYKAARSRIYKYFVPTYFLKESNYTDEYIKRKEEDLQMETQDNAIAADHDNLESAENESKKKSIYRNYTEDDIAMVYNYRSDSIALFRRLMEKYVGTHDYSNFTVKSNQGATKRFIRSITVSESIVVDGIEYVEIEIHGQSFLLHQIRKMVSFAVLNSRYSREGADKNFEDGFEKSVHVPKAPSQYLYLSRVLFDDYNKRAEEKIEVDEEEKQEFERNNILPTVYSKENLFEWLKFLDAVRFHHENFSMFK